MKYIEIFLIAILAILPLFGDILEKEKQKYWFCKVTKLGWIFFGLSAIILAINCWKVHLEDVIDDTIKEEEISSYIEISSLSKQRIDSIAQILPSRLYLRGASLGNNDIAINYEKENTRALGGRAISRYTLVLNSDLVKLEKDFLIHSFHVDDINNKNFKYRLSEIDALTCIEGLDIKFVLKIRNQTFPDYRDCNTNPEIKVYGLK